MPQSRARCSWLMLLPLLYGALYLWSFWDPYDRLDRIPRPRPRAHPGP